MIIVLACVSAAYAVALLAIWLRVPRWPGRAAKPRSRAGGVGRNAGFPSYRRLESDLAWTLSTQRLYDHGTRPILERVVAARLADRRGIDLYRQPGRARAVVGEELWPLIDPGRPRSFSDAPGPSIAVLRRLVDTLEVL